MKVLSDSVQGDYGTIFQPKKAGDSMANQPANRVSDRDLDYEFVKLESNGRWLQLKAMNKFDVGYVTLDGGEHELDFSDTLTRPYTLIVKATVHSVVIINDADVTGYKERPARINVHRNQIVKIRATKAHGVGNQWFIEIDGETDGLVQKIVWNGEDFLPNDDGVVELKASSEVDRMISEAVEKATLYWND